MQHSDMQVQGKQVNALLRKSWAYQRRNVCMNVCVLLSPIILCAILGVMQIVINNLIGSIGKVRIDQQERYL
jgi:cell division protein FtsX